MDTATAITEFDEWAKRFEAQPATSFRDATPPRCMYAVREGPHKRACLDDAFHRSAGLPVCSKHRGRDVRKGWRGYIEGA